MIARDVMTENPSTVGPRTTVAEAWDTMRELDVRHVPVVQSGSLVGMLSDRDLASLDVARVLAADGAEALLVELGTPVHDVMTSDVVSVGAETALGDVIALFLEHKIGAVPVVEPGSGTVIGIVSYIDVLRALQDLLEEE